MDYELSPIVPHIDSGVPAGREILVTPFSDETRRLLILAFCGECRAEEKQEAEQADDSGCVYSFHLICTVGF
jgi:hypothetical protein